MYRGGEAQKLAGVLLGYPTRRGDDRPKIVLPARDWTSFLISGYLRMVVSRRHDVYVHAFVYDDAWKLTMMFEHGRRLEAAYGTPLRP